MKKKSGAVDTTAALQRSAEAQLKTPADEAYRDWARTLAETDPARRLHELQVHQIELEMQNAELEDGRERMEELVDKYTDLYEFAPVGYFSVDEKGRILQVNLTGAFLLGWDRAELSQHPLIDLVAPASQGDFEAFLARVFAGTGKKACEVSLVRKDGSAFWADLHSSAALTEGATRRCRIAVSDVSALKRADELARTNAELKREVDRRLAVEVSLRQSQKELNYELEYSHEMAGQLRLLTHRLVQAQEDERNRISRELHDDIAQVLVGIQVQLQILVSAKPTSFQALKKRLSRTQRLVVESIERVQAFARDLRPAMLDDLGLAAALRTHLEAFSAKSNIPVSFEPQLEAETLGNVERTALFRVAQSALSNVAKHAHATRVEVRLWETGDRICLEVQDNGRAFEVGEVTPADGRKRLGLLGMRERINMIGGTLQLRSGKGVGTTVRAELPKK